MIPSNYQDKLPQSIKEPVVVTYRSIGIGTFGVIMRYAGMPLEKIALFMNSSQVSGKNPFSQSIQLAFKGGFLAPYKVVGPASLCAWFFQYSIMGFAFQSIDRGLSSLMKVRPVYYGSELMEAAKTEVNDEEKTNLIYQTKFIFKTAMVPVMSGALESMVSNRAEVQRYFGLQKFAQLETKLAWNPLARAAGPAFLSNATRNMIMSNTSFVLTPMLYKLYFPQQYKSKSSLFWTGLSINIFVGNVFAITQQSLWGRSLDYYGHGKSMKYCRVIKEGLQREGLRAFFTPAKWSSRVLMNAPAQGVLPWFYNEVLPIAEPGLLNFVEEYFYAPMAPLVREDVTLETIYNPIKTEVESLKKGTLHQQGAYNILSSSFVAQKDEKTDGH